MLVFLKRLIVVLGCVFGIAVTLLFAKFMMWAEMHVHLTNAVRTWIVWTTLACVACLLLYGIYNGVKLLWMLIKWLFIEPFAKK